RGRRPARHRDVGQPAPRAARHLREALAHRAGSDCGATGCVREARRRTGLSHDDPGRAALPAEPRSARRDSSNALRLARSLAVSGPDLPASRGGPPGRGVAVGTPAPTAWILYDTPATNDRGERTGQGFSTAGTWPPGFDTLPDRCH